jgi:hypothetical protein
MVQSLALGVYDMKTYPTAVRVYLRRQPKTGLFAAVSDDLPGLMTVADNIEEIERRLPASIEQLIKAQYGADVVVVHGDADISDDFKPLDEPRVIELRAA